MAPGAPQQSIVQDADGDYWITVEERRDSIQPAMRVHTAEQGSDKGSLRLGEFTRWERPVEGAREVISELAFERLCTAEGGRGGATRRLSVKFMPHQHRPLALFEGGAERQGILIADEVGTGKTYAAGHILHHGLLNGSTRRALILCPARIAEKWGHTLRREFHIRCWVAGSGNQLRRWLEGDTNGFDVMVSSYDKGRATHDGASMIDYLEGAFARGVLQELDLAVFDEVHNLIGVRANDGEAIIRRRMANLVSLLSRSRVGLTATPIWRGAGDVVELAEILRPLATAGAGVSTVMDAQRRVTTAVNLLRTERLDAARWDEARRALSGAIQGSGLLDDCVRAGGMDASDRIDLANRLAEQAPFSTWITRTRSEEVGDLAERIVPEADLVDLGDRIRGEFWDPDQQVVRQLPSEERAVEELQGMLMHLNHHLQLSSSPSAFHSFLPKLIARDFIRAGQEDRATELSLELANVGIGSKETRLVEVLTDVSQRRVGAILFTHWHETFDRLIGGALDLEGKVSGLKVYPAHYGSEELREANVNRFLKHDDPESFPLLIATDMLSEGVDLQDTADCIIHYDLPWNPQKVEQRIGRVDRIGQGSDSVEVRYVLLRGFADHRYLQSMGRKIREFEENIGKMRPVTPESFLQADAQGGVTKEMRERIEAWNLETIAGLDLRGFNPDDLPDGLQSSVDPGFSALASERVYRSLRQVLPPETEYSHENSELVLTPPQGGINIEPIIESDADRDAVRKALGSAYTSAISKGCANGSFAIPVKSDGLPSKHVLRTSLLGIASLSAPEIAAGACVIHPGAEADRVELFELASSAGSRTVTHWLALEHRGGQSREMDANEWQSLLSEAAETGSLCTTQGLVGEFGGDLLEQRTREMHNSEIVWERHRLLAEARRCFAIASHREQVGEQGAAELRDEGEALKERAEGLDYQSLDSTPPRLRLVVKGSP